MNKDIEGTIVIGDGNIGKKVLTASNVHLSFPTIGKKTDFEEVKANCSGSIDLNFVESEHFNTITTKLEEERKQQLNKILEELVDRLILDIAGGRSYLDAVPGFRNTF